jgi:hypothetical protein
MFQIGSHIIAYSNSCIDPILYAFLSPPFLAGFQKLIPCVKCKYVRGSGACEQQSVISVPLVKSKPNKIGNLTNKISAASTECSLNTLV